MTNNDEARWLSDRERDAWIGLIAVLYRVPAALDQHLRDSAGMTHFNYQVMVILSAAPERTLCMSELAQATGGSLSRLSQVSSRLEKAGWISRCPDPDDGRTTLATLTEVGFEALANAAPGHVEQVRQMVFDPLTAEQVQQLADITNAILQSPATGPDPRPGNRQRPPK